jgi:hypothetical protein
MTCTRTCSRSSTAVGPSEHQIDPLHPSRSHRNIRSTLCTQVARIATSDRPSAPKSLASHGTTGTTPAAPTARPTPSAHDTGFPPRTKVHPVPHLLPWPVCARLPLCDVEAQQLLQVRHVVVPEHLDDRA